MSTNSNPIIPFSDAELVKLCQLISMCVHGPEHGICTIDMWKDKCGKLEDLLHAHNLKPWGQWMRHE